MQMKGTLDKSELIIKRLEERFDFLAKKRNLKLKDEYEKIVKIGFNNYKIRCQGTLSSKKQCGMHVKREDSLYCKHHSINNGKGSKISDRVIAKVSKELGVYGIVSKTFLDEEIKKVQKLSDNELLDIKSEIGILTAIIHKLMIQIPKPVYEKGKIKYTKEEVELKMAKNLQYSLMNLATIKKMFFDVKFSANNMISKEIFEFILNQYKQILVEEVKDVEVLKKVAERLQKVWNNMKSGGLM